MDSSFWTIFVLGLLSQGILAGHFETQAGSTQNGNNNRGGRSSWNSWGTTSTADQYDNLRRENTEAFNNEAPNGNMDEGCPVAQLSFMCHFGSGIRGRLLYNRCQYYDPNPQTRPDGRTYMCAGDTGIPTTNYRCDFCCNQPSAVVPSCSLGTERYRTTGPDRPPPPPNSKLHCGDRFKGNLCSQSGSCNNYCCISQTAQPCLTPLCPADADNNPDDNSQMIQRQCQLWQNRAMGMRGILTRRDWNQFLAGYNS